MDVLDPWMGRTRLLLGDEALAKLIKGRVVIAGLGGVGGIAAEMIARAGVGHLTIIDADVVESSNANRQVIALSTNEGQLKAEAMAERLKAINPAIQLEVLPMYLNHHEHYKVLDQPFDFALDCIDTLSPKVFFIKACLDRGIPLVSSMGAGGKTDPSRVRIADISETHTCKLARYVRKRLHQKGIYKGITTVFSDEEVNTERLVLTEDGSPKKSIIGTISYLPAIFGCFCAGVALQKLSGLQ
jgi:tRNA A37 threonylcarbamoyladenosine dehydratase